MVIIMDRQLTKEERKRIEHRGQLKKKRRKQKIVKRILWIILFIFIVAFGYMQIVSINKNKAGGDPSSKKNNQNVEQIDINDYVEAGLDSTYITYIRKIVEAAGSSSDTKTIIDNIEKYPKDVLDLLISNPETLDFALGYLTYDKSSEEKITLSKPKDGEFPLYLQWDARWGYKEYGDNMIAINGCGPACLSMVAVGLLHDTSLNPKKISDYSVENGYYDEENGTLWELMKAVPKYFGLKVSEIGLDKEVIINHLKKGHPIIASMSPGDFTTTGHYIVLTGINDKGEVTVNDPNSIKRSSKKWDLDTITGQVKNLWAYSKR